MAAGTIKQNSRSSKRLLDEAERFLVAGVNSPVRAFRHVGGDPVILTEASGACVFDAQGRVYRDFIMGWGALILGHQPPSVVQALRRAVQKGILFGLTHPAEIELAKRIVAELPSLEQVRFTASGTEACMTAVRLARAYTKRTKILTLDGCYHGHSDSLLAHTSAGIPGVFANETLTVPFNDLEALEERIKREGETLACVILEPVCANSGVILPEAGYLEAMRQLTQKQGVLLIFDEVVTGFRLGLAGAQGHFGIHPDLTTFGKIIGAGLPIGAVGGSRKIMQQLAPSGGVYHAGTFAGHPLSMAAGLAMIDQLKASGRYAYLERLARRLVEGLKKESERTGIPIQINQIGSMLTVFFSDDPIRNATHARASRRDHFAKWARVLREEGVLIPPSPFESLFLSATHRQADVDLFVSASRKAFQSI